MVTLIKYGALSGGEKYNVNVLNLDGLSADAKPTVTYIEYGSDGREIGRMGIPNGSLYTEINTGDTYMYDAYNTTWHKVSIGGGGGSADSYTKAETNALLSGKADLAALTTVANGKADEQECVDIRARLDALEYIPIKINSFTASPSLCEMGSENTIELAWSLNKTATSQNINGSPVTGNSKQYTGVTTGTTYTLNVSDGQTSANRSVSVSFANRIYYGAAAGLSDVTALTGILSNNPERTITVDAGTGEYIIYAIPARLGDVTFFVSGFEGGFEDAVEQTLTNGSGYQEAYKVYRSTRANLGETTVEIKEV